MKKVIITLVIIITLILIWGAIESDSRYYGNLLTKENLKTPDDVFKWVEDHYDVPTNKDPAVSYNSPRFLIENRKVLWCDEGALVMAILDHYLGYQTRLLDLYGADNISHHTVMQVLINNKWTTYDYTYNIKYEPFVKHDALYGYPLNYAKPKPYPKLYNLAVNSNYVAKKIIFGLRGISEH